MWPFLRRAIRYVLCACHYRFRLYAESLSLCLRERESNQRESAPGIRVSLRETSLATALFRGASRWAIPGPSFLVWHPCQTPLYTAPPLGLLTGPGNRGASRFVGAVLTAKLLTAVTGSLAVFAQVLQALALLALFGEIVRRQPALEGPLLGRPLMVQQGEPGGVAVVALDQ